MFVNEEKTSSKYKWIGLAVGLMIGIISYYFGILGTTKLVLALIVLSFVIKKPIYSVVLYIASISFVSDMNALLIGIVVIACYGINFIREGNFKFKYTPANFLILLFAIIIVANTFLSVTPSGSFRDFTIHLTAIGILFMLVNSKKNKEEIHLINTILVLTATLISIYGIYQYFTGVAMGSGWIDVSQNPDVKTRVFATFENPNLLAEFLIMVLPISIGLIFYSKNYLSKIIFTLTAFVIFICDLLTLSRGSWIGFAFSMVIFILLIDFKKLAFFIPAGIGSLFLMPNFILQRISTIGSLKDSSNLYRFNLLNMAIDILKDFWFSGIGIGYIAFRKISPFYIRTMAPYHTHNTYLQIAIELGIAGIVVFALLILSVFRMGVNSIMNNSKDRFIKIFTVSYIASLCAILVHGVAEHVFFNPKIILVFWLIVGMNLSMYTVSKETNNLES